MKPLLTALCALALTFGIGVNAFSKGTGTFVIDWHPGGKKAPLSFTKHKAAGVRCKSCHPRHKNGKRYMKGCGTCHKTRANAMKIGHKMCIPCHKATKGPKTCSGCHPG